MQISTIEIELKNRFDRIGARIEVRPMPPGNRWRPLDLARPFLFDIRDDRRGQIYDLQLNPLRMKRLLTLDVRPADRHLLLMFTEDELLETGVKRTDHRVLCGHDEREWFLAGLPEQQRVTTVTQAMEALKPNIVINSQRRRRVKTRDRNRRRNGGFVRQGEWFFVPDPTFEPHDRLWHRNEPLSRGEGKPHVAEYLVRIGGRSGYTRGWRNGEVLTEAQFRAIDWSMRWDKPGNWIPTTIEPVVYVKGTVRHPDHKTIDLPTWHRVVANTEQETGRGRTLTFID